MCKCNNTVANIFSYVLFFTSCDPCQPGRVHYDVAADACNIMTTYRQTAETTSHKRLLFT